VTDAKQQPDDIRLERRRLADFFANGAQGHATLWHSRLWP
jgi:hypothetical protein